MLNKMRGVPSKARQEPKGARPPGHRPEAWKPGPFPFRSAGRTAIGGARRAVANPDAPRHVPIMRTSLFLLLCAAACTAAPTPEPEASPAPLGEPVLTPQASGTTVLLQAVSAADDRVVWASGHAGTFTRTVDGGARWDTGRVPGADSLEFRDVHAVSADTAYLLSAGSGDRSRIYKTVDGGRSWALQFRNAIPEAFFDCFAFWSPQRGLAFSDAVGSEHFVLLTDDGGTRWRRIPPDQLPVAITGEGSFASSGTCVAASGSGAAFIGMGNAAPARVMRTPDGGRTWDAVATPLAAGEGSGAGSVVVLDSLRVVVLGGTFGGTPPGSGARVAISRDGGESWAAGGTPTLASAVYGAAHVTGTRAALVAVGPGGVQLSRDGGRSWSPVDTASFWSIDIASPEAGWMVGPGGRIVRLAFR